MSTRSNRSSTRAMSVRLRGSARTAPTAGARSRSPTHPRSRSSSTSRERPFAQPIRSMATARHVELTELGAELAAHSWQDAFWGRGSFLAVDLHALSKWKAMPEPDVGTLIIFFRLIPLLDELGIAVRVDGAELAFVAGVRTAWANPTRCLRRCCRSVRQISREEMRRCRRPTPRPRIHLSPEIWMRGTPGCYSRRLATACSVGSRSVRSRIWSAARATRDAAETYIVRASTAAAFERHAESPLRPHRRPRRLQ